MFSYTRFVVCLSAFSASESVCCLAHAGPSKHEMIASTYIPFDLLSTGKMYRANGRPTSSESQTQSHANRVQGSNSRMVTSQNQKSSEEITASGAVIVRLR